MVAEASGNQPGPREGTATAEAQPALIARIDDLHVVFPASGVAAVRGVSVDLYSGETIGVVGESGSGKSMLAKGLLGLLPGTARIDGTVAVESCDMIRGNRQSVRKTRGRVISLVLQNPASALNPVRTVRSQLREACKSVSRSRSETTTRIEEALRSVDLDPGSVLRLYPHQLSGGMKQRVCIALALIQDPDVLVADEPTTALDVRTQLGILRLVRQIQSTRRMSVVLISHDIAVVYQLADRVVVMYSGKIVEDGPAEAVVKAPQHPYTQGLVKCVPHAGERRDWFDTIPGQAKSGVIGQEGCAFRDRCTHRMDVCEKTPPAVPVGDSHRVACWLAVDETERSDVDA